MKTLICSLAAAAALVGCNTVKGPCMRCCPAGSYGLNLPFDSMNAGHLILSKDADDQWHAKLLWRWASPYECQDVKVSRESFSLTQSFSKPKGAENDKSKWRKSVITGAFACGRVNCVLTTFDGNGKVLESKPFDGVKNPPVGPAPDMAKAVYGTPVSLLAGTMADFELMGGDHAGLINGWTLKDGVLSNRIARDAKGQSLHKNGNLRTKRADFYDFKLSYDVRVLPGCNSGMYLRGIYEIQVLDSFGKPVDCHNMAAFYGRITPSVAAEKKAGEWQHVDVTLYKRHVTVVLNGVTIIDNKPVEGITGGAMTANEFAPGPLYIQGDHSDADFRNLVLTPIVK